MYNAYVNTVHGTLCNSADFMCTYFNAMWGGCMTFFWVLNSL